MHTIPYSAELGARLTVARDAAAAYGRSRRAFTAGGPPLDWYHWSDRLCIALDSLLDLIDSGSAHRPGPGAADGGAAITGLRTPGTGTLSASDMVTVRAALRYALKVHAEQAGASCPHPACGPGGCWDQRTVDTGAMARYRYLLERIEASP
jgi:hypothetical protein